jgi:RHS repeat-associated protein
MQTDFIYDCSPQHVHSFALKASRTTGKERDTESGLDYFGARYYSSSMGRWMSPDWNVNVQPVPYASLGDPQSLNLYAYVGNHPLSIIDPDGHNWFTDFAQGLADSTYRPIVHIVEHPIAMAEGIGTAVAHPIVTGKAIGSAVVGTVEAAAHGDGRAIGQIVGTVGTAIAGGAIARGVGVAGEVGAEAGSFVGETTSITTEETYAVRLAEAQEAYPNKAGTIENHHIAPKYLGGATNGPTVPLDGAYHQMITNEFRNLAPYGSGPVSPQQLQNLQDSAYSKFPLPSGSN